MNRGKKINKNTELELDEKNLQTKDYPFKKYKKKRLSELSALEKTQILYEKHVEYLTHEEIAKAHRISKASASYLQKKAK